MQKFRRRIIDVIELINGDVALLLEDSSVLLIELDLNRIERSIDLWKNIIGEKSKAMKDLSLKYNGKPPKSSVRYFLINILLILILFYLFLQFFF